MYDYLILTAAITRPDLHAQLFSDHLNLIGDARVKWLINVDDVNNGVSVERTVRQLRQSLDAPNVDLEFLTPAGTGCFFSAARTLAERAAELLDHCRTGVVWLEDDWALQRPGVAGRLLTPLRLRLARNRRGGRILRCPGDLIDKQVVLESHERQGHERWFVSLVPRSRVSFNPGIWSRALFVEAFHRTLAEAEDRVDDPETLCADPLNQATCYDALSVFVDPRYQDAGRLWSALAGLRKWRKDAPELQARGAVTYASASARSVAELEPLELDGSLLCPDLLLGSRLGMLGRVRGSRLDVPGVPFLQFDLVPAGGQRAELYMHRLHGWSRTYPVKRVPVVLRRAGTAVQIEVGAGARRAEYYASLPPRLWWRLPLQSLLGTAALVLILSRVLGRLDAE